VPAAQTVLIFVLVPLGLYLLIYLLVAVTGRRPRPRYRSGQPWHFPPHLWTASAEDAGLAPLPAAPAPSDGSTGTGTPPKIGGGASGNW
jgi:hypothetical protein